MDAQRLAWLMQRKLARRVNIDAVDFAADRQRFGAIHDLPVMVGPVAITRGLEPFVTDRLNIRHYPPLEYRCAALRRSRMARTACFL